MWDVYHDTVTFLVYISHSVVLLACTHPFVPALHSSTASTRSDTIGGTGVSVLCQAAVSHPTKAVTIEWCVVCAINVMCASYYMCFCYLSRATVRQWFFVSLYFTFARPSKSIQSFWYLFLVSITIFCWRANQYFLLPRRVTTKMKENPYRESHDKTKGS